MKAEFPKELWFKDYPNHVFAFLELKNVEGYALYICRNSSIDQLKRVHTSYYNGATKVAFLTQKEMFEDLLLLVEREVIYYEKRLRELK